MMVPASPPLDLRENAFPPAAAHTALQFLDVFGCPGAWAGLGMTVVDWAARRWGRAAWIGAVVVGLWLAVVTGARAYEPPQRLRVALADDNAPYSFVTEHGEPRGYVRDMWELWSQRTGVAVEFLPMHWPTGVVQLKLGDADVVASVPKGTADPSLRLSAQELAKVPHHLFYNRDIGDIAELDDLAPFTVGVVATGSCDSYLRRNDVRHLRPYPSMNALADAVAKGEVSVFCGGRAVSLRMLRRHDLDMDFKMSPLLYQGGVHWATRQWDADLHQFIAAGFARITPRERDEIASRWQGAEWQSERHVHALRWLVYILLAALAALAAGGGWILTLRRQVWAKTQEVRASELRSANILNALPELAWIKDLDGRFLAVNASLANLCSVADPDAMIGRSCGDFFPGELVETYRRNDETVIRRMEPIVVVEPIVGPTGGMRWIESTKVPFLDENGRCIGTVGIAREITSRKAAEEALAQALDALQISENRYRTMIGALPVGVFEIDRDGTVAFANSRAWDLLGLAPPPQEGWAEPWVNLVHPEECPAAIVALRRLLTRGTPLQLELRLVRADGEETWVQAVGVRNTDTEGAIISVLDVSKRHRAEDSLRAREEEFRILAENSPDTIARYDLDARRLYANPILQALAGQEAADMLGRTPTETFATADMQAYEMRIRDVARTGCSAVHELAWTGAGGIPFISEIRLVPEYGRAGSIAGVIAIGRDVTRLKQVEGELRAKTETLAAVLENLPGNAFTMRYGADGTKQLLYTSRPAAATAVGLCSDDPRGRFHPDDHALLFEQVPDRLRQWGYSEHKFRLLVDGGDPVWMHARERVREWRDGDMIVDGLVFDISAEMAAKCQLERTAEELRVTAVRLSAVLDNLPGLAYRKEYWPDRSEVTYTNANHMAIFGRLGDTRSLEKRLGTIWHPDDHQTIIAYDAAVRAGRDVSELKLRFFHADGSVRWGLVREKVLERRDGLIVAEGMLIDITAEMEAKLALEQKAAELAESARRFESVLNNLPGLIFRMEMAPDNNKRMVEVYGRPGEESPLPLSPEGLRASVHPDDRAVMYDELPARLRANGTAEQTFRAFDHSGGIRWLHTREKTVGRRDDGTLIVEGQLLDVTAEVVTRQNLENSERQRLRAEARLQQGRRFEALGQFAGGIAHDFNNLLGAMLGYARFIEEDHPPETHTHRHASRIVAAGNKGRAIVEQILNYTRRMELALGRFELGDLIGEVVSFCSVGCADGISLDIDHTLADMEVQADRLQLTRTLMNLCINARDALEGRSGTIRIGAHQAELDPRVLRRLAERDDCGDHGDVESWAEEDGTCWVVGGRVPKVLPHVALYVEDDGAGMDSRLLENAFQPFFTTKDRSRGAGLGLAVVLGVVIAHGGALIGRSKPGEGTRFDLLLPTRNSSAQPVDVFVPVSDSTTLRVMVVDDHVDVLDAVTEALTRLDFLVEPYSDPNKALEAFRAAPDQWDLVITDQIMPGLRGIDLVRAMRAIRPDLPCLLCSGYAEELDEVTCKAAGVSEMLKKPLGFPELMSAIERAVGAVNTDA